MTGAALRVAAILMGTCAIIIVGLFAAAFLRGWRWKVKGRRTAALAPEITSALVDHMAGNDDLAAMRRFFEISRSDVANSILSFQDAVAGSARDRLCALILNLDLLDEWRRAVRSRSLPRRRAAFAGIAFACSYEPCRRAVGNILPDALEDRDREVRVSVAQALARFGSPAEVERVFRMALHANLATRAAVAGPLRAHALQLAAGAVREALRSDNAAQILAALEMVLAWERALPLEGLSELIRHRERAIRIRALRAVPLAVASRENETAVMESLADPDPEIAEAAAAVAGRMRILAAVPLLARCCRSGNTALARTAATAMAALPPQGWKTLEELSAGEDRAMSAAAAEALAHVRTAKGV